jgi:predicted nucleotidyltransferase
MLFPLKIFLRNIKQAFSKLSQIEKVILYGSRAKGNYKDGSDIDITLIGKNLKLKTVYETPSHLSDTVFHHYFLYKNPCQHSKYVQLNHHY